MTNPMTASQLRKMLKHARENVEVYKILAGLDKSFRKDLCYWLGAARAYLKALKGDTR